MGWGNFLVLATLFMMREIDAAAVLAWHLEINVVTRTVSLKLRSQRRIRELLGARGLGHFCVEEARCDRIAHTMHAGVAQLELLQGKFGFPLPSGLPLFPTSDGEVCAKVEIIKCLEATSAHLAYPRWRRTVRGYSEVTLSGWLVRSGWPRSASRSPRSCSWHGGLAAPYFGT